jgi:hypothetical protein
MSAVRFQSPAPLVIDAIVVKKKKDAVIGKNIALIFREVNIIEYKSPKSYVSVADFPVPCPCKAADI